MFLPPTSLFSVVLLGINEYPRGLQLLMMRCVSADRSFPDAFWYYSEVRVNRLKKSWYSATYKGAHKLAKAYVSEFMRNPYDPY